MKNKITYKIKRLLALASDKAASQNEAESAMAKVHELLAQHNLSFSDLNVSDEQVGKDVHDNKAWNQRWEKQIWNAVSQLYFCTFYYVGNGTQPHQYVVVGRESNRLTAQYVSEYVVEVGKKLALEYAQNNPGNSVSLSNHFKKGFALAIHQKAMRMMHNAKSNTGTGTGLVLANLYDVTGNENALAIDTKLTKSSNSARVYDKDALNDGKAAGSKVSLSPQVSARQTTTQRIGR